MQTYSNHVTKETSVPGLTLRSFATRLVSATVAGVTMPWVLQLVDIVGAAVLYVNGDPSVATVCKPVNTDFSCYCTLSHSRMLSSQPGRELCITSVQRWTCGHHFCACSSLEAIPVFECVVAFVVYCHVVIFSFCICQILVMATYIN